MRIFMISWFLMVLVSCSGGGGGHKTPQTGSEDVVDTVTLEKISISPHLTKMALGTSVILSATGIYSDQSIRDISDSATWSTDDQTILVYDDTVQYGMVRAAGVGLTKVRVSSEGIDASLELMVSPATLESLTVSPAQVVLPLGGEIDLAATGFFSDQSSQDVTPDVVWTVDNPFLATLTGGRLIAESPGNTNVTGSYGGQDYTIAITVTNSTLTSLEVSPAWASLATGLSMDVYVTGIYSDNSKRDVTKDVGWDSSDESVASVAMAGDRAVLSGKEFGQVTLTARLGSINATSIVTVTAAELSRIEISAGDTDLPEGFTRKLKATGIYADGSMKDLTSTVIWGSSDEDVAVVSNAWDSKGLMTALSMGTVEVGAGIGAIIGTVELSVNQAVLEKLDVSAGFSVIPAGLSQNIQATGLFSDQSLRDLTDDVTWMSSNTQVALVGNGTDKGVLTGITPGNSTITAFMGSLSAEIAITVNNAELSSIEISPNSVIIPVGMYQQFKAIGLYSDNTTWDLTSGVTWGSSNTAVALPDNSEARAGLFYALSEGSFDVSAGFDGVSASVQSQVSLAELDSVFITVTSVTLEKGMSHALTVMGLYSDSSTRDLTENVVWESEDHEIARVENGVGEKGLVYGEAIGTTRVTALINGLEASCEITVTAAGIASIEITAPADTLAAGTTMSLSATGYFNDGSERDITDSVLWESSDMAIAVTSNANGEKGLIRAYTDGSVIVTATYKGVSGQISLTVSQATLTSIEVLPAEDSLPSGFSVQYQAIGHFSDASVQDMTKRVVWSVSDKALARISNWIGLKGRMYTISPGSLTVSAAYGEVTGQTSLTVTGESLVAVQLIPSAGLVEEGQSKVMVLAGLFSDDSVRNLSQEAYWLSTDLEVFTVSNAIGEEGTISGQSAGKGYAIAVYSNLGFVAPVYVIGDLYMGSEQVDDGIQFSAYGDFGGDTYINMTELVTWSSDDESILAVSNVDGERGLAQVNGAGTCQVTSTFSPTMAVTRGVTISFGE